MVAKTEKFAAYRSRKKSNFSERNWEHVAFRKDKIYCAA